MKGDLDMKDFKDKVDNAKDKLTGEVKEAAGKISGNEKLELKGKLLKRKAKLKKKIDVKRTVNGVKNNVIGKINNLMDNKKKR